MEDLVFYYPQGHEAHFEHGHPERPDRIEVLRDALQQVGYWEAYPHVSSLAIPNGILTAIHDPEYLTRLEIASQSGRRFDADTYITGASWDLSRKAAGGAIAVAEAVWDGTARRGFALTRPPGHHATSSRAMGFCLLNNIALAAEYLLMEKNAQRLAIVDIDLHHGNGTQDIFYNRGDVFYFSTHQYPLYPGTGRLEETGVDTGEMRTMNMPLPPYSGDVAMKTAMETLNSSHPETV